MTLNPGSKVTTECDRVGKFPFSLLKGKDSLASDALHDNVRYMPPLVERQNVYEETLRSNELVVCTKEFLNFMPSDPLRLNLRIEEEEEPPTPPQDPYYYLCNYRVIMRVSEWAAFGGGKTVWQCESPLTLFNSDNGPISYTMPPCPWTATGCTNLPGSVGVCRCGQNYTGTALLEVNPNHLAPDGSIAGLLIRATLTVTHNPSGQVTTLVADRGAMNCSSPTRHCAGTTFFAEAATVSVVQSMSVSRLR